MNSLVCSHFSLFRGANTVYFEKADSKSSLFLRITPAPSSVRLLISPNPTVFTPHIPWACLHSSQCDTFSVNFLPSIPSSLSDHSFCDSCMCVIRVPGVLLSILYAGLAQFLPPSRRYVSIRLITSLLLSPVYPLHMLWFTLFVSRNLPFI